MFASRLFALLAAAVVVSSSPHTGGNVHRRHADIQQKRATLATVYESCTKPKNVALTFDDGPYIYLEQISDMLTNAGAKGTFFMNGFNYDCIYDPDMVTRVKYAYNAGHMIGDHTWAHKDLATMTTPQIQDAMYRMEEAFSRILGIKPAFMRPPFGSYNDNVRQVAFTRNQSLAMWDQDTGDSDGATVAQSKAVYDAAVADNLNTMLVLNHEPIQTTVNQVLPYAIQLLQSHGYQLVTLAECLGVEPYVAVGIPQTGTWSCDNTPQPGAACGGSIPCQTGVPLFLTATTTTTSTSTTTTTTTTTSAGPTVTGQVIHPSASSSQCLSASGTAVVIKPCDGTASQSWTRSGNTLQVNGQCLTVPGGSTANGVKMQLAACAASGTAAANQQFTLSGNTIVWTGKGQCLDLTDGSLALNNPAQMWQCAAGNQNQLWNIVAGGTTPPPTTTTTTTTSTTTGTTPTGKTIRPNASNNLCLSAAGTTSGSAVQVKTCSAGSTSQSWTQTGGTLKIFSNMCLTVPNGSTTNGVKMQITTCATSGTAANNQKFTVTSSKNIQWTGKGECLDLTDGKTTNNNPIQMWQCFTGNTNQVWNFV